MNNDNRNEEAVSPVIATILMVAITVVLAGVLYVWASSLAGDSTGGGLDTFQFSDRDAAGALDETGGNPLVHIVMDQGDGVSWALLEVSIVVDGGNTMKCVEASAADETSECTYEKDNDKTWEVAEEITISEGSATNSCDGVAGYCSVDITLSKKAIGDDDGGVLAKLTATAEA